MPNLTLFLTTVFLGFFAMLNPTGNTPIFLSVVGNADKKTIKKVARLFHIINNSIEFLMNLLYVSDNVYVIKSVTTSVNKKFRDPCRSLIYKGL